MSFWGIVVIEFLLCVFIIWGFTHEDKFCEFEYNIYRVIVGNYRRWKRLRGKKNGR